MERAPIIKLPRICLALSAEGWQKTTRNHTSNKIVVAMNIYGILGGKTSLHDESLRQAIRKFRALRRLAGSMLFDHPAHDLIKIFILEAQQIHGKSFLF